MNMDEEVPKRNDSVLKRKSTCCCPCRNQVFQRRARSLRDKILLQNWVTRKWKMGNWEMIVSEWGVTIVLQGVFIGVKLGEKLVWGWKESEIAVILCLYLWRGEGERERMRETFMAMMAQGLMITKGSNRREKAEGMKKNGSLSFLAFCISLFQSLKALVLNNDNIMYGETIIWVRNIYIMVELDLSVSIFLLPTRLKFELLLKGNQICTTWANHKFVESKVSITLVGGKH